MLFFTPDTNASYLEVVDNNGSLHSEMYQRGDLYSV
jgi:hypothetical protein